MPCGKWDTGRNECHETFRSGVESPAAKKTTCGILIYNIYNIDINHIEDSIVIAMLLKVEPT